MRYRLSVHARRELDERDIPEALVQQVLDCQEQIVDSGDRNVYQSRIDFSGKVYLLRIVVVDTMDPKLVVTVYRTARISKYWSAP